jgi:hypothetical protein
VLTFLVLAALHACGAEPVAEPPTAGSSMADALRKAAAAVPAEPDPAGMPERLVRESQKRTVVAEEPDSEACADAKRDRDKVKKRLTTTYDTRIKPAEDRAYQAQLGLNRCLKDMGGCGADPNQYKSVAAKRDSAKRALERELTSVGELEAKLFPLNREVSKACGTGRF